MVVRFVIMFMLLVRFKVFQSKMKKKIKNSHENAQPVTNITPSSLTEEHQPVRVKLVIG